MSDDVRNGDYFIDRYLLSRRKVVYHCDVTEDTVRDLVRRLLYLDAKSAKPVELSINSTGGSLLDAFAAIDVIEEMRSPVVTIGRGDVCSAALLIFMCDTKRRLSRRTSVLTHQPEAGEWGRPADLAEANADNKRLYTKMVELYIRYSALTTVAEVERYLLVGHDVYLSPEDAVRFGLADELIDSPSKHKAIKLSKDDRNWFAGKKTAAKRRRKR